MKLPIFLLTIVIVFCTGCAKEPVPNEVNKVSIISIAPASGPAGTTVVIKGDNFGDDLSDNIVKFNNDTAAVLASSVDSLVVIAPANGTTGPVTVAVAGSIATGPVFTYSIDSVDVYVAGPAYGVVYWKNGQEVFLEPTQHNFGGAYGIAISDTNVYVGSYTYFSIPGFSAAYWKNRKKIMLSSPDIAGEVRALVLSGSDLYVGGGEGYRPAYWKNGVKYSLSGNGRVNALAINGNDVYAAGYGSGPVNEQNSIYWKNGIETVLGKNGVVDIGATSIALNGNDVYVCATDSGDAVYWKNGLRVILEKFPGDAPVATNAIAIAGNSIYVVGSYRGDAVYWKDGTRITLPKRGLYAAATAITFYQSDIYIGGRDGNGAVYWKNGVRVPLCCSEGTVSAIAVVKKP
jgi:IPT/TIG domain